MIYAQSQHTHQSTRLLRAFFAGVLLVLLMLAGERVSMAAVVELNSTGGTTATNGLHFFIEDTTHMQVRRLNNTGQVYSPGAIPPSVNLDNGVFLLANTKVYGPSHTVSGFNPTGGMYNTYSITAPIPANPSSAGVQQIATNNLGITAGPQVTINWKYTTPLDFLTADVTIVIPPTYTVSVAKPVRYYHVFDTYLGGSDSGCGVKFTDSNGKAVVGTYPPPSGTTCPSSTSIPAGVTIVESFRERSGLAFSKYCAAGWSTFFTNGGVNCSVLQTAPLSNTIVTSYQDTGIGVEFDFTAPGTYTFSYDFVIGSTVVPAYDHLEIVHDGTATLCPENVTILACTSSTVPCPAGASVNTGTLTGNLKVTPALPAVSITPATFSIGPAVYNPTVVLQGTGAGTYTLSISGISGTVPLNGVKCSNGSIATSCIMTIANTPCVADFECMETGQPYNTPVTTTARNPLYTKLVGTAFTFDVLALQSSGAIATGYTGAVTVELFDATAKPAPFCAFTGTALASQTLTYLAGDNGRKTLAIPVNLSAAYPNLRCQVRQTVPTAVSGCSSDAFAVRPSAIALAATTLTNLPMATAPSSISTPTIKAGTGFMLSGTTSPVASYSGSLALDASKLSAQVTTQDTIPESGGVVGTLTPSLVANAAAISATYNEVGYLYLAPGAYRDDLFTAVDGTTGDCITDTDLNANLSDALSGGKYGCSIGNKISATFGRFIPHHFTLASSGMPAGCVTGGFTYMDQPFTMSASIEARSLADTKTFNYAGPLFARGVVTPQVENANSGVSLTARLSGLGTPFWTGGNYPFVATNFSRQTPADGPYDSLAIGLAATDESGAVLLANRDMDASNASCVPDPSGTSTGTCTAKTAVTTKLRHGRLKLGNAHGSERLDLPVPLRLEYWAGVTKGWAINALDTCSNFSANNFSLSFPTGTAAKPNNLAACETYLPALGGVAPAQTMLLKAPGTGNNGWTDVVLNLASPSGTQCVAIGAAGPAAVSPVPTMTWLQYHWTGAGSALQNPSARATFGIYKNANEFIYMRELH
ncbi:MAG: hypothetical protein Q7U12_01860 [Undibacterium sp.]|nr:hypothetical protein [Undibacterium sp.]